jgi:hypothetical protein
VAHTGVLKIVNRKEAVQGVAASIVIVIVIVIVIDTL